MGRIWTFKKYFKKEKIKLHFSELDTIYRCIKNDTINDKMKHNKIRMA